MIIDDTETRRDSEIIEARIAGKSVRAIARERGCSAAEVNKVIDRFADQTISHEVRKHTLALELERLDRIQAVYYERALAGDVQSAALVTKIIERRGVMLGLHCVQTQVLRIVDEASPKETSTDKIERALAALTSQRKSDEPDEPTAH